MMHRKLRKDRVFRHMARDVPEYKIVYVSRDDLVDDLDWREVVGPSDLSNQNERIVKRYLSMWSRLAKIRFGEDAPIEIFADFDIDFNRYRFGGRILPMRYVRVKVKS